MLLNREMSHDPIAWLDLMLISPPIVNWDRIEKPLVYPLANQIP
jgi:hypothetical protein